MGLTVKIFRQIFFWEKYVFIFAFVICCSEQKYFCSMKSIKCLVKDLKCLILNQLVAEN